MASIFQRMFIGMGFGCILLFYFVAEQVALKPNKTPNAPPDLVLGPTENTLIVIALLLIWFIVLVRGLWRLKHPFYGKGNIVKEHESVWDKAMPASVRFAACINNEGCDNLELHKAYQVLADESAMLKGYIRVIDDSGEDYLYPQTYFLLLELSHSSERALLATYSTAV